MKKALKLLAYTVLTLIVLSPLVMAGPRHGHRHGTGHVHTGTTPGMIKTPTTFAKPHHPTVTTTSFKVHHPTVTTIAKPHHPTVATIAKPHHPTVTTTSFKTHKPTVTTLHGSTLGKKNYVAHHGTKFKGGVFFAGKSHKHWSKRCWSPRWGCWCWHCPSSSQWYYWCATQARYYPVTYIASAPPVFATMGAAEVAPECSSIPQVTPEEGSILPE